MQERLKPLLHIKKTAPLGTPFLVGTSFDY
jgi:hypothetical protein